MIDITILKMSREQAEAMANAFVDLYKHAIDPNESDEQRFDALASRYKELTGIDLRASQ